MTTNTEYDRVVAEIAARRASEREACRKLAASITLPIRGDRRAAIDACHSPDYARDLAVAAVLECVARLARTAWGFKVRHRSGKGRKNSTYIVTPHGECRVSDHTIPVYGERAWRYETNGGPRWNGELIVEWAINVECSPTWWRRAVILASAGRI